MTTMGHSLLRPYRACIRSACSVLVGRPVLGPPRWMSKITSGSSAITASPIPSPLRAMPGPLEAVTPMAPPNEAPTAGGGAAGGVYADGAADRGADGGGDRGDLVLGLERAHPPALVKRKFLKDARGRRDRVGAEHDRDLGALRRGKQAPGERPVARHAAVDARRHLGGLDAVVLGEHLGRLTEGVTRLENPDIGLDERGVLAEALLEGV